VLYLICVYEKHKRGKEKIMARRKTFGYMKVRLKDLNITYVQLSKELNVTPFTVSNKLNGKADIWLSELEKIIEVIGETDNNEICKLLNFSK
jgi:predicted transcriptional regulator